jgi:YD repeat-containing protein
MPKPDILLSPAQASPFPLAVQSNALHSLSYLSIPAYQPTPYVVTNSQDQDTTTSYNDDGSVSSQTNHLGETTQFAYDSAGRLSTATTQDGQQTTLLYTLNSLRESISVESQGTTSYTYDNRSQCTSKTDPIQGTLSYTYNTRGDTLTDEQGTYSYDLLGRKTALSFAGGGSDSWSYTPDGLMSSANGIARTYDDQGNVLTWNDGTNSATYSYTGGSTSLGLPSSTTAQGQASSYSYTYNTTHWLYTLNNTSKPSQGNFTYSWSTAKELTSITNPNSTQLSQTYNNKQLDHVQVQDSLGQTTYLSSDATYNAQDQMTAYDYTVSASPSNFSTSTSIAYHTSGSNLGKVNTLTDANRTITYGYNAQDGLVSSVQFSTLGTYSFSRNSSGTMDTITYPNQQGTASFSYSGGLGKLSQIAMPGNQTISLGWNGKSQVSTVTGNNNGSSTAYSLTYNGSGQITYMSKSSGGMQQYYWHMDYGPHGLEKARQYSPYDVLLLTQDFTTDPTGRILSMTYTDANPTYQYNGEYYFHYDHSGNMCLLTDTSGNPAYSLEYDFYNGKITNQWNPHNLTNLLYQQGETGAFSLPLGMSQSIIGDDYIVPLFSNNSGLGRWALGLDPGIGFHLPGDRWWVRTVSEKIYWFGRKNCRGLYRCIDSRAASMFGNDVISYRVYYFFSDCPQKAPMDGLMMIFESSSCPFCKRNKPLILERPPIDYPKSEILCTLVKCECDRDLIPYIPPIINF